MKIKLCVLLSCFTFCLWGQNGNLRQVTIVRDSFGVPHVFGKTNDQVAYGLAWVQCEDQFKTMQEVLAACRGFLGEINGKDGVVADIGIQFMGIADFVDKHYEQDVKGEFRDYLESFVQGVNDYATAHPSEVLLKKLFPISGQDVLIGYLLGNVEISGAGRDLQRILNGRFDQSPAVEKGSNAFAFAPSKTIDGHTYLAINSHQPLEGWYSWYEAHLHSEEGLNIIGGTFAGGVSIFLGANEHLGWAHTVNHPDLSDVYRLSVNTEETAYLVDNEWRPLIKRKARARAKLLGFLKIPVSRDYFMTDYGPAFKTDKGFFAWNFMAGQTLMMAEQWWKMNLATNLEEFQSALRMRGIPSTNIVYADKQGNIYYISNGRIPQRDPAYNWAGVLPGNTARTFTDPVELVPFDSLPQVLNPSCGWVFNTNNTPFTSSAAQCSPLETELNDLMGYQETGDENNRSVRFLQLMEGSGKLSYDDFKRIKYDHQYPEIFQKVSGLDVNILFQMQPEENSEVADLLQLIQKWDRKTDVNNIGAAAFLVTIYSMNDLKRPGLRQDMLAVAALKKAKSKLLKNYGKLDIRLGELQRHSRGEVSLPMAGGPDVLAALYSREQKDGTYRAVGGESYIEMVRFSPEGVEVESINAFGNSEVEGHPYSTSQMDYYATQRLKKMSFSKEEVLKGAVRVYKPE